MDAELRTWLESGAHLPVPLQAFHAQKLIFKRLDEMMQVRVAAYKQEHHGMTPPEAVVNWQAGQIYVLDVFLWFFATHGYTLQKTRLPHDSRPPFCDLMATMAAFEERQFEAQRAWLEERRRGK